MIFAVFAKTIGNGRRVFNERLAFFVFTVENAQRVLFKAAAAIFAELVKVRTEHFLQFGFMFRAAFGTAHAVQAHLQTGKAEFSVKLHGESDDFTVQGGIVGAEGFDPKLMELAETPFLRTLITEHGPHVVKFYGHGPSVHFMFDKSPGR